MQQNNYNDANDYLKWLNALAICVYVSVSTTKQPFVVAALALFLPMQYDDDCERLLTAAKR